MPMRRNLGTPPLIGAEPWPRPPDDVVELYNPALTLDDGDIVVVSHRAGDPVFRLYVDVGKASVAVALTPGEWAELRGAANRAAERIEGV